MELNVNVPKEKVKRIEANVLKIIFGFLFLSGGYCDFSDFSCKYLDILLWCLLIRKRVLFYSNFLRNMELLFKKNSSNAVRSYQFIFRL